MTILEIVKKARGIRERSTEQFALDDTIKIWEMRVDALDSIDESQMKRFKDTVHQDICPLCKFYYKSDDKCYGCPIMAKTGQSHCHGTPFGDLLKKETFTLDDLKQAVAESLQFLKGLK